MTWGNPPPFIPDPPKNEVIPISKFIISRQQAKSEGLLYYFTGKPCRYGHIAERAVSSCDCKICHNTQSREYGRKNIAKIVENFKVKTYGVTPFEYGEMLWNQNFKCKLCDTELGKDTKAPHLDHNHKTGKIRGILCHHCNTGLGLFKDSITMLEKAIEYLRKTNGME